MKWALVPYILPTGRCPVYEFLRDLRRERLRSWAVFELQRRKQLEENGPIRMGPPYWQSVGGSLGEIRWSGPDRVHYRIYGSIESNGKIVMYLGEPKRWRVFRNEHREICEKYRADYRSSDYDDQQREFQRCAYYKQREK